MYKLPQVVDKYVDLLKVNDDINKNSVNDILKCAQHLKKFKYIRILDIGCGLAPLLKHFRICLQDSDIDYTGLDSSVEMINKAKELNIEDHKTSIKFLNMSIQDFFALKTYECYNIIIAQSFIHLLLDDKDINNLVFVLSNILTNDGIFYIATKNTVESQGIIRDDVHIVKKIDDITYERRIFTEESLDNVFTSKFDDFFDINTYVQFDANGNKFYMVTGIKNTLKFYNKNHFAFGYNEKFKNIQDLLNKQCTKFIEYVDDPIDKLVIRKEQLLLNLYETHNDSFIMIMNVIHEIFKQILPEKYPVYIKDKINMNKPGWKFPLHQDASAGWKKKIPFENVVTIGIPLEKINCIEQGGTRIVIGTKYCPEFVNDEKMTKSDHTLNIEEVEKYIGNDLKYLLCYGAKGSYYCFDQYVMHDSSINNTNHLRNIMFITCGVSNNHDDMYSIEFAKTFNSQKCKKLIDKEFIEQHGNIGDFHIDSFGKIVLDE